MNNINDERHLNAIAKATEGDEWECEKEWREERIAKHVSAIGQSSIMEDMLNIKKLSDEILGGGRS